MTNCRGASVLTMVALFLANVVQAQPRQLWFPTSAPELAEPADPAAPGQTLFSRAEYAALVAKAGTGALIPIVRYPDALSSTAGVGINFVFGGKNRGFAVDGSDASGYVLYADVNGNGDLADDEPLRLERRESYFTTLVRSSVVDTSNGETTTYPVEIRFFFARVATSSGPRLAWRTASTMIRRGKIESRTGSTRFALFGTPGFYDKVGASLWVDLDGDGQGWSLPRSMEVFQVVDRRIKIAGTAYAFDIDPFGRSLTLTPLDAPIADWPSLAVGTPAPDFSLVDLQGQPVRLAHYRGRVLLLDVWAKWCGPCRAEAPRLAALYEKYRERGLAIVGLSPDLPEDITAFVRQFRHTWPQVSEPYDGPAHRLLRVVGYPTHVLIDRDGRIALAQEGDIDADTYERLIEAVVNRDTK